MSLSDELDLSDLDLSYLEQIALKRVKPDYWPDPTAAKDFATSYPATFLALIEAARAEERAKAQAEIERLKEALTDLLGIIRTVCPEHEEATMCANARALLSEDPA